MDFKGDVYEDTQRAEVRDSPVLVRGCQKTRLLLRAQKATGGTRLVMLRFTSGRF